MVRDKEWLNKINQVLLAIEKYSPDRKYLVKGVLVDLLKGKGPYSKRPSPQQKVALIVLKGGKNSAPQDAATS